MSKRPAGGSASPRAHKNAKPGKKDPFDLGDEKLFNTPADKYAKLAELAQLKRENAELQDRRLALEREREMYEIISRRNEDDGDLKVAFSCLLAMLCVEEEEFAGCYKALGKQLGCRLKPMEPWSRTGAFTASGATGEQSYAFVDIIEAIAVRTGHQWTADRSKPSDSGYGKTEKNAIVISGGPSASGTNGNPIDLTEDEPTVEDEIARLTEENDWESDRIKHLAGEIEAAEDVQLPSGIDLSHVVSLLFLQDGAFSVAGECTWVGDYLKDLLVEFCQMYTALGKQLGVKAVKVCPSEGHFIGTCTPESYPLTDVLAKLAGMRAAIPSFPALKM